MKIKRDNEVRKRNARGAYHHLKNVWKSGTRRDMKVQL